MNQSNTSGELAGASQEADRDLTAEPREIFPLMFEKDYLDFRPAAVNAADVEEVTAPKSSSAPASVALPTSPTGLEDVSAEDLENPARANVEKGKSQPNT